MNRKELLSLQDKIFQELDKRTKQERDEALRKIRSIADEAGLSLDELVSTQKGKSKSKAQVKYRDPNSAENTWAGRGRKPRWLEQALANGRNLEDFAV
jgi:DNA-binding protein H-NS